MIIKIGTINTLDMSIMVIVEYSMVLCFASGTVQLYIYAAFIMLVVYKFISNISGQSIGLPHCFQVEDCCLISVAPTCVNILNICHLFYFN